VRHVRMLGLCLVAVLAVCAYAVSSASALPEWGKCEAKAGGNYKDANCTEKAKPKGSGAYEWRKGETLTPVPFYGENVGSGGVLKSLARYCEYEDAKHINHEAGLVTRAKCAEDHGTEQGPIELNVECEKEFSNGESSGKASVKAVSVKFKGCKAFGAPCSNTPAEGEIQINALKGNLGYISKSEHKVGILLEPEHKKGEFAKFDCGGIYEVVVGVGNSKEGTWYVPGEEKHGGYDGVIGAITPVNQMTEGFTEVYTMNPATAENIPSKFEGKHIELLENYLYNNAAPNEPTQWSPAGEEITNHAILCNPAKLEHAFDCNPEDIIEPESAEIKA